MNIYCLYFPNGKRYVGTETVTGKRIGDHRKMRSLSKKNPADHQVVHLAIKKYGWETVKWRYLTTNCSNEDGWRLEKFFISAMKLQDPEWGYNRSAGGPHPQLGIKHSPERIAKGKATRRRNGTDGIAHLLTPEVIEKRAAKRRGKPSGTTPWNKGRPGYNLPLRGSPSEETKRKISKGNRGNTAWNKGRKGPPSPRKGKTMSEESRKKMSLAKLGKSPQNTGRIGLPAGPNGEVRYFRPESIPYA